MEKKGQRGHGCSDGQRSPTFTVREDVVPDSHHSAAEVTKLKEMLTQRDNEISIL